MTFVTTEADPVPSGGISQWLTADDGTRFRVARFSRSDPDRGTVVILNGRTEFIEKYFEVIRNLLDRGYTVATLDWRGQGMSDRPLENRHKGHVEDFALYVSDLRQALTEFIQPSCPGPYRALCHSMGGNIGLRYLHQHGEPFEAAVFSAPMWGIGKHSRPPHWMRIVGGIAHVLRLGAAYIPGGQDYGENDRTFVDNELTHDPSRFERFVAQVDKDPRLELGAPTLGWVQQAIRSLDIIHAPGFAEAIEVPVCVCSAGADTLVSPTAQEPIASRLPHSSRIVIDDSKHELLMEIDAYRDQIFAAFDQF